MAKRVFVTADRVPGYTDYIVAGKEYEMKQTPYDGEGYGYLFNEEGTEIFICISHCAHLDGMPWTVRIEE